MRRSIAVCVMLGILGASRAHAQLLGRPLCEVGSSTIELLQFSGATGFVPTTLRSSVIFLAECPSDVVPAFRGLGESAELHARWIEAVRSGAQDSSNTDLRAFLAEARHRVVGRGDAALNQYLEGMFDGPTNLERVDPIALQGFFERQAAAVLRAYSACGGAACFNLSDNLLFLLGTHPVPLLRAMHADSVAAAKWLRSVADDSFSGDPAYRQTREGARRDVLATLAQIRVTDVQVERRACVRTLRSIRYQAVE